MVLRLFVFLFLLLILLLVLLLGLLPITIVLIWVDYEHFLGARQGLTQRRTLCYTGFAGGMTTMQIFFFTLIVLALFVAVYWDGSL